MASLYMMNRGFSFGISDVTPGKKLIDAKNKLMEIGYTYIFVYYLLVNNARDLSAFSSSSPPSTVPHSSC